MKKFKKWEDIEPELDRILVEAKSLAKDIQRIEQKVDELTDEGIRFEPIGSTDIDLEYLKFKARRAIGKSLPSGSLS